MNGVREMLKKIQFSDNDVLYILGDLIDRGPDGIKIIQDVMKRNNVCVNFVLKRIMFANSKQKKNISRY